MPTGLTTLNLGIILGVVFNLFFSSLALQVLIYGFLVFLGYVWGGLRKLIKILLIPGMIVHYAGHFIAVKLLSVMDEKDRKVKRRKIIGLGIRGGNEWQYGIIRATSLEDALVIALVPVMFSIPLFAFFSKIFFLTDSLFFAWLSLAVVLEGLLLKN